MIGTLVFLEGGSVVNPRNRKLDILVNYKMQTPLEVFTINIRQQKQIVIKSISDFNKKKQKIQKFMLGTIMDFDLDGTRQGTSVLGGICQAGKPVIC